MLFLQFGEETRRVHITHEVSSLDTLHALIAHMFPQKLTVGMLKSPNTAILIKDEARNVFYELEDVRWARAWGWVGVPHSSSTPRPVPSSFRTPPPPPFPFRPLHHSPLLVPPGPGTRNRPEVEAGLGRSHRV